MSSRVRISKLHRHLFTGDLVAAEWLFGHYFNLLPALSETYYYLEVQVVADNVPLTVSGLSTAALRLLGNQGHRLRLFAEAVFVATNVRRLPGPNDERPWNTPGIVWKDIFPFEIIRAGEALPRERYEALAELRHWLAARHINDFNNYLPENTTLEVIKYA